MDADTTKSCSWIKFFPSLTNGIQIANSVDAQKFEQFLNRINANLNEQSSDIFTPQELSKLQKIFKLDVADVMLAIKTTQYLLKRMMKFIFKPVHLKSDLIELGIIEEKADLFIKAWSGETRSALSNLVTDSSELGIDSLDIKWQLSAELSSDVVKKSKVPKACITLNGNRKSEMKMEMSHQELYGLFLQLEGVQTELDNFM